MDINCLDCTNSACCKVYVVEISKEEYEKYKKLGLHKNFETRTDIFLKKNSKYKTKRKELDEMHTQYFAEAKKRKDGYCTFLDKAMRCSIYENRPKVCAEYKHNRCENIRCIKN